MELAIHQPICLEPDMDELYDLIYLINEASIMDKAEYCLDLKPALENMGTKYPDMKPKIHQALSIIGAV